MLKLYFAHMSIQLRSAMQHKVSFFLQLIGHFLLAFTMVLAVWCMMDRFHLIDGFTLAQVMLCFSISLAGFTFGELFFRGFDLFPQHIRSGDFDRVLLKPRPLIFSVLCLDTALPRFGRLLQALLVLAVALPNAGIEWTWAKALTAAGMLVGSAALYSALFVLRATVAFFTIDSIEFMNIFIDGARDFGSVPVSVYGDTILKFLTFVLPLACVQYWPLLTLLDRGEWWYALLPLAGLAFWLPALAFWRFGVRRYRSTGS